MSEVDLNLGTNYVLCSYILEMLQFIFWNRILIAELQIKTI
jgi:hypothetical protein